MSAPRYKLAPYAHQAEDVLRLAESVEPEIGRVIPNCMLIAHEPRVGKTKEVIDAAQLLFERDEIDRVLVVTLRKVRDEWYHPQLGQIGQNLWDGITAKLYKVHSKTQQWERPGKTRTMYWFVTNYDFIRGKNNLPSFLKACNKRTILVIDESASIAGHDSKQSRAILDVRKECGWVWELNGTPVTDSPAGLFNQARTLDPRILGIKTWTEYRSRYAKTYTPPTRPRLVFISGWNDITEVEQKLKPYVMRRLKDDVMPDLPPKLPPKIVTATLSDSSWKTYKELRDDFISFLTSNKSVTAPQAVVRSTRLSQIVAGILGGVTSVSACPCDGLDEACKLCDGLGLVQEKEAERVVGDEKIETLKEWAAERWVEQPDLKIIVWCRFKSEMDRAAEALREAGKCDVFALRGGQTDEEQQAAQVAFHPATTTPGRAGLVGHPKSGGVGLNLAASSCTMWLSLPESLFLYEQGRERPHGPGQKEPISYWEMVAEGPTGQQTIDHKNLARLRSKKSLADRTSAAWVTELREE